ncbi:MAG: PKD domain-containing protein [Methanobacteriota archaeon]|nr:MAG: PKD domain-containing protein [Euryarchaeota archaeon]
MKKRGVSRCGALLVVLLMMMSAAIMLPSQNVIAQDHDIWGIVMSEESGCIDSVSGVVVNLTNVHGTSVDQVTTAGDGVYRFPSDPGFYELETSKAGYFQNMTGPFRFDGNNDMQITPNVCIEQTPSKDNSITGTVLSSLTNQVNEVVEFTTETMTNGFNDIAIKRPGNNSGRLSNSPVVSGSYVALYNNGSGDVPLAEGADYNIDLWNGVVTLIPAIASEIDSGVGWLNFTYDYSETVSNLHRYVTPGSSVLKNALPWDPSGNYTLDMDSGTIDILGNFTFGSDVLTVDYTYHPTPIPDASLQLYYTDRDYIVSSDISSSSTPIGKFDLDSWTATFELRVRADGYQPNVSQMSISDDQIIRVLMDPGVKIFGWAYDSVSQSVISDVDVRAYMFCVDGGVPESKRLLEATIEGSKFTFYAYPGNYNLIVDADGYEAKEMPILVQATNQSHDIYLDLSEEETYETTIEYVDNDWNMTIVNESWTLNMDSHLPILGTAQLGSLPLEVDLAVGDSNGAMSDPEFYTNLTNWLTERGPRFLKTTGLFLTDSEEYTLELDALQVPKYYVFVEKGSNQIWINTTSWYNTSALIQDQDEYTLWLEAVYDSAITIDGVDRILANRTYRVTLPTTYELIANTSANTDVLGFTDILIDPKKGTGTGTVTMRVQKSEGGIARAAVIEPKEVPGNDLYFWILGSDWDNYSVVVPAETEIQFSAEQSTDNNTQDGQISPYATFSWNFGDGSDGWGISPIHNYSDPGTGSGNYTVRLNITDPGGNVSYREINVKVDARIPTALAEFDERDTEVIGSERHVDEDIILRINATRDDVLSEDLMWDGELGNMTYFEWDFDSDGIYDMSSTEGQIETDFFTEPGEYTINLTITDWVGHKSDNYTKKIIVDDTTPPEAVFFVLNETFASTITALEGTATYFNATDSTDNFSELENLTFKWEINNISFSGMNVSHNFTETGDLPVNLTVIDEALNEGYHNISIIVVPNQKIHSDLSFEEAWEGIPILFEPSSPEVGTSIKISVNVTNSDVGVEAEGVEVTFSIVQADQTTTEIGGTVTFYDEDGNVVSNTIAPGGKVVAVISWNPTDHGVYTIRAECNATNEHESYHDDHNTITHEITVCEAGWVTTLITVVLIVLIFFIAIILLLRRRFGGRFPSLRRKKKPEKKEKKKKKKKKVKK